MKPVPHGEPYAGNLHVRFDEGAGVPDNKGRSALLYCLSGQGLVAAHWGDADLDGLNIAALVQDNMPGSRIVAEEVIAVPDCVPGIPLTDAQRRRLARFLERNPACPYGDCLKMLLDRGCWYEQESFPLG